MAATIFHRLRRTATACRRYLPEIALAISTEVIASVMHLSVVLHVVVSAAALIVGRHVSSWRR
jgi:hypothetical protein